MLPIHLELSIATRQMKSRRLNGIGYSLRYSPRVAAGTPRTVLTPKAKAKALAMAKEIGDKVRIDQITPKVRKR